MALKREILDSFRNASHNLIFYYYFSASIINSNQHFFLVNVWSFGVMLIKMISSDLEVIKLEYCLRIKIKRNDWLLADACPRAANHCPLFWVCSISSRPDV